MKIPRQAAKMLPLILPLFLVLLASLGTAGRAEAAPGETVLQIELLHLKTGKLVYRGTRVSREEGGRVFQSTIYQTPEGKEVQRTESSYDKASLKLVSYKLSDSRSGQLEEIRISGDKINLFYRERKGEELETEELDWEEGISSAVTVMGMIRRNLELLGRGEAFAFELIVPSRLETIGFRLKKDSEVTQAGVAMIVLRMEPDSWLIRQLVDPMFFYIAAQPPHRLIEYRGRVSVKSDDGEDQDLRVIYLYPPGG